jgi:hypothetical protein
LASTHGEGRVEPEHIGQLLSDSIRGHEEAFDRSDPNYERHFEWMKRHHAAEEFASRYGDRWHEMPDEELDRIDAEEGGDARFDDMLNHVLGDEAPAESDDAAARPFADEAPEARAAEEDPHDDDDVRARRTRRGRTRRCC